MNHIFKSKFLRESAYYLPAASALETRSLPEAQGLRNRKVNHVWLGGGDLTYENVGALLAFHLPTN